MEGIHEGGHGRAGDGGVEMKKEEYLQLVTDQIRCKKARPDVKTELENHILDQMESYRNEGMEEQEAMEQAILEMGDPIEVGVELDRIHRPKMSWGILLLVEILGGMSVLLQFTLWRGGNAMAQPERQLMFHIAGFLVMLGVYFLDYSILGKYARRIGILVCTVMILVVSLGHLANTGGTFIMLGCLAISVPLVMYLYVPVFGAILYSYRNAGYEVLWKSALWLTIPVWVDLRCSLVHTFCLLLICLLMFSIAVWKQWYQIARKEVLISMWVCLWILIVGGVTVAAGGWVQPYMIERIRAFLQRSNSYTQDMMQNIFEQSRWIGKSASGMEFLENSLPGFNSELILTSVMACFGILPGILTVLLYLVMIWKIFGVSKKQQNQLGTMIGYGCGLVFASQVAYSVFTYLRVLRISSVILPFLSVTGGGTMVAYLLMGMVLSIYRYKNIPLHPEKSRLPRIRIIIE